ncbi:MAG: AraC family ligand binding domain-containing protein [Victivallaceae bacterium]|nr:AraC family ligand binding domain-containing protein [Victivallaceae bacterium]
MFDIKKIRHMRLGVMTQYSGSGFFAGKVPVGTHGEYDFHDHDFIELALVTAGSVTHLHQNRAHKLHCGDILLIAPGIVHAYCEAQTLEIYNLMR